MSSIMDVDSSPQSLLLSPRYLEVASSSKPYPVARLLDRITGLQSELRQERQWRADERGELERRHQADLDKTKSVFEAKISRLQDKQNEDVGSLKEKVTGMETTWHGLEAKANSVRSEVEVLRLSISVLEGTASTTHASEQTAIGNPGPPTTSGKTLVEFRDSHIKELQPQTSAEVAVVDASTQTVINRSGAWSEEKAKLIERQGALETTVAALQAEAKSLNEFIVHLQARLQAQRPVLRERYFKLAGLQLRNATSSDLYKEWAEGFKDLTVQIQRQSELVQKAGDAFHSSLAPATELRSSWADEVENELSGSTPTGATPKTEKPITARKTSCGPVSANLSIPPEPTESKGHKRTLSAVHTDEPDAPSTDVQRRRTGLQSYVSIPGRSITWRRGMNSMAADFRPLNLSPNWRGQPALGEATWQDRFNGLLYSQASRQPLGSSDTDFSATNEPLEQSPTLSLPAVSLPPSAGGAGKVAGQKRLPEHQENAALAAPRFFREGGIPFKVPTPRPKKWQNSVLKKNR